MGAWLCYRCESRLNAACGQRQSGAGTDKKEGEGRRGGDVTRYPKGTAHGSIADDEGGEGEAQVAAKVPPQRKHPPAHGQLCGRSAGVGVRLGLVENYVSFTDADQKTRRFKHHKDGIPPGPPSKGTAVLLSDNVSSALPVYVYLPKRVRQAIHEILARNWKAMGRGGGPRASLVDFKGDQQYVSFRLARTTRLRSPWCQETVGLGGMLMVPMVAKLMTVALLRNMVSVDVRRTEEV